MTNKKKIVSISVSMQMNLVMHQANNGLNESGNMSSIKKTSDDRNYISGQMIRHSIFESMFRNNNLNISSDKTETYISSADGIVPDISKNIRADMGGYMIPVKGGLANIRQSPLCASFAIAENESINNRDLMVKNVDNQDANITDKIFLEKEFSENDTFNFNLHLNVIELGTIEKFEYKENLNIERTFEKIVDDKERFRRLLLFLDSLESLRFSNSARANSDNKPSKIIISINTTEINDIYNYFEKDVNESKRKKKLESVEIHGGQYFIGNDDDDDSLSVTKAIQEAKKYINNCDLI
jgi:CRISPR-associated protein Cas7/Csp1